MKVQKVKLGVYDYTWLVLDDHYLPIQPITEFIRYLKNIDKSPFTLRSYAHHLKLYWQFLLVKQRNWTTINLADLAAFVGSLRPLNQQQVKVINLFAEQATRKPATINAILGCLASFYRYHHQLGHTKITFTESKNLPSNRYKSLLYHAFKQLPGSRRIIAVKPIKALPKTIPEEHVIKLVALCTNDRDKFLIWLLYETGLRIGQALALRHDDIIAWDNVIRVKYRTDNLNQVRNKSYQPNTIHVSSTLMAWYSDYINTLDCNQLTDYVFVNLKTYTPLTYSAVKKIFLVLSQRGHFYVRPHLLRHTHANALVQAGWDMALIQKRLGHVSVQTTINTYTHLDTKHLKDAFNHYLLRKES